MDPRTDADLDHDALEQLRKASSAWRILRADSAPLILSFLGSVFVTENIRLISATDLESRLDDHLYSLNEEREVPLYAKSPKAYLDDWASPAAGYLRKFYPPGKDEPHFDVTPAVERAVAWVEGLRAREFVGTESRLNTVVELLRQIAFGSETDPDARMAELERQRRDLDRQMTDLQQGHVNVLSEAGVRDRYQQFAQTARELLSDFREVEANFRTLDRRLREQIATWAGSKGELLDSVVGNRSSINESDQGRSFQAFYDFLLSRDRQQELSGLLDKVHSLTSVGAVDTRLRHIHYDWLDAGERTQSTVRLLSEQLRRFLDDQVWLENRRVMDILRSIESTAIRLRAAPPARFTMPLELSSPAVHVPMERPLYTPQATQAFDDDVKPGSADEIDASALFDQLYVDTDELARTVTRALRANGQVDLEKVLQSRPLEHGLAELVAYLSLTDDRFTVVHDDGAQMQVGWVDAEGVERIATLSRVTFARDRGALARVAP